MTQLHVWRSATSSMTAKSASTPARTSSMESDIKHAMRFEDGDDDDDDFRASCGGADARAARGAATARAVGARSFDSGLRTAPRCTNALKLS